MYKEELKNVKAQLPNAKLCDNKIAKFCFML